MIENRIKMEIVDGKKRFAKITTGYRDGLIVRRIDEGKINY